MQNESACNSYPDVDFLSMNEEALGVMGFEDFDFSMDFPLVNPMPAASALSF